MPGAHEIMKWDPKRKRWVIFRKSTPVASSVKKRVLRRRFPDAKEQKK